MDDLTKQELAREVYDTVCATLDSHDWRYQPKEEELTIICGAKGDDLPIELVFRVDPKLMMLVLYSPLPGEIPEDKRLDVAVAVGAINNSMVDGNFDYSLKNGKLYFRMTAPFIDNTISQEAVMYILMCTCKMVDMFNDRFVMLAKGLISLDQVLDALKD